MRRNNLDNNKAPTLRLMGSLMVSSCSTLGLIKHLNSSRVGYHRQFIMTSIRGVSIQMFGGISSVKSPGKHLDYEE